MVRVHYTYTYNIWEKKKKRCRNYKSTTTCTRYLSVVRCMWQIRSAINIWLTLYSGINSAPLIVRAASLSTVSSSSLSAKRVPTRTWPRSEIVGIPFLPRSVPRFLSPPMPPFRPEENIFLFFYVIYVFLYCRQCTVVVVYIYALWPQSFYGARVVFQTVLSAAGKPRHLCDNRDPIYQGGHVFFFVS